MSYEHKDTGDCSQGRLPFWQEQALRQSDRTRANSPPDAIFIELVTAHGAKAACGKTFRY